MRRTSITRWAGGLLGAAALVVALALPAGAKPPPWSPPGAGSGSTVATQIAICCTWGTGIEDGITYSIDAPDAATHDAIAAGVEEWESEIGNAHLHFDEMSSGAEVTIRFKRGGGTVAGSTSRTTSGGWITGATMSISGKAFGTTTALEQLTTVTAHEWGHVLGLNHANGTGLLMSPVLDPSVKTIQSCDLGAAKVTLGWFLSNPAGTPVAPPASYVC